MVSETHFVGFVPAADNREDHLNRAPCWAGGWGVWGIQVKTWGKWGRQKDGYSLYPWVWVRHCESKYYHYVHFNKWSKTFLNLNLKETQVLRSIFSILSGFSPLCLAKRLFQYTDAERRIQLGSRQFHYTESSCFSSGSRPLCRLPGTQNWKHGTNNIMCYSNFAPGLVICPSAVTSVADRADVPASLPVFPRHLSLKLSRLHNRPAIEALTANYICYLQKNKTKKKESQRSYVFMQRSFRYENQPPVSFMDSF